MLFDWNTIAFPASVQDLQLSAPLTLSGEGLWVCLVSSGQCSASVPAAGPLPLGAALILPPQSVPAGHLILSRAPLALVPESICHLLCVQLTGHSRARSQLAYALLCELADADSAASALPPLVQAAIEDIRANYAGLYGVEELSERLGVSKSHLVRTFTAAIGVPPGKYLTTVRVEAAQRLLLHREYTLDVVASLCGFSGANYLCRVFKKETGQSPAQWRAMAGHAAQSGLSPEESLREQELYI